MENNGLEKIVNKLPEKGKDKDIKLAAKLFTSGNLMAAYSCGLIQGGQDTYAVTTTSFILFNNILSNLWLSLAYKDKPSIPIANTGATLGAYLLGVASVKLRDML